jgi:hypothetical protein
VTAHDERQPGAGALIPTSHELEVFAYRLAPQQTGLGRNAGALVEDDDVRAGQDHLLERGQKLRLRLAVELVQGGDDSAHTADPKAIEIADLPVQEVDAILADALLLLAERVVVAARAGG